MTEVHIVLKKIDMRQNVVEDQYVQPVRVVVIIERDSRAGVDDGLIWITRIKLIPALFF